MPYQNWPGSFAYAYWTVCSTLHMHTYIYTYPYLLQTDAGLSARLHCTLTILRCRTATKMRSQSAVVERYRPIPWVYRCASPSLLKTPHFKLRSVFVLYLHIAPLTWHNHKSGSGRPIWLGLETLPCVFLLLSVRS